jgi:transcription antitermination factor NusG
MALEPVAACTPHACHWHALRLASRHEFAVRDALRAANVTEFLPTFTVESRWSDRIATVVRPLFAGYIFARFAASEAAQVTRIRGVVNILSIDQKPVPISDGVIADLRRAVESPAPLVLCPYVAGSAVRVKSGPLAGAEGVITRIQGNTLLTIPIEILGRAVSVKIDAADVEALGS